MLAYDIGVVLDISKDADAICETSTGHSLGRSVDAAALWPADQPHNVSCAHGVGTFLNRQQSKIPPAARRPASITL